MDTPCTRCHQSHTAPWWGPSDTGRWRCSSPADTSGASTSRSFHPPSRLQPHCYPPRFRPLSRRPRCLHPHCHHPPAGCSRSGLQSRRRRTKGCSHRKDNWLRCCHTTRRSDQTRTGPAHHNSRRSSRHHTAPSRHHQPRPPFRLRCLPRSLHRRRSRRPFLDWEACTRPTRTSDRARTWCTGCHASHSRSCRSRSCTRPPRRSSPGTWWENTAGARAHTPRRARRRLRDRG